MSTAIDIIYCRCEITVADANVLKFFDTNVQNRPETSAPSESVARDRRGSRELSISSISVNLLAATFHRTLASRFRSSTVKCFAKYRPLESATIMRVNDARTLHQR